MSEVKFASAMNLKINLLVNKWCILICTLNQKTPFPLSSEGSVSWLRFLLVGSCSVFNLKCVIGTFVLLRKSQ